MKNKITKQQEGTLFLFLLSSLLFFIIELQSSSFHRLRDWLELIISSIVIGIIITISLVLLFSLMKRLFKW